MVRYILAISCMLLVNLGIQARIVDPGLLFDAARMAGEKGAENEALFFYQELFKDADQIPPETRIHYANGALEWLVPTHHWKESVQVLELAQSALPSLLPLPESQQDLVGELIFRAAELCVEFGFPSRNNDFRRLGVELLSQSLHYLSRDNPHYIYSMVQRGLLKRVLGDLSGALEDFRFAQSLVKDPISKGNLRVQQGFAAYYCSRTRQELNSRPPGSMLPLPSFPIARIHLDSVRIIVEQIETEEPKDIYFPAYLHGQLLWQDENFSPESAIEQFLWADSVDNRAGFRNYYLSYCQSKLSVIYFEMGQYLKAIEHGNKSIAAMTRAPYPTRDFLYRLLNTGASYVEIGEFTKAQVYQNNALDLLKQNHGLDSLRFRFLYGWGNNQLASSYQNPSEKRIFHLEEALKSMQMIPKAHRSSEVNNNIPIIQTNLGFAYAALRKDYRTSNAYYTEAIQSFEEIEPGSPRVVIAMASIADNHLLDDSEDAVNLIKRAERYQVDTTQTEDKVIAEMYLTLGSVYQGLSMFKEAIAYFHLALKTLSVDPIAQDLPLSEQILERNLGLIAFQDLATCLEHLVESKQETDTLELSLFYYEQAVEMIHILRQQQNSQVSQVALGDRTRDLFESGIRVSLDLYQEKGDFLYLQKAFDLAEQSRGLVLLAAMATDGAAESAGVPDSILVLQKELQTRYDDLIRQSRRTEDEGDIDEIRRDIQDIINQQEDITQMLKDDYPRFYEEVYETETASIPSIQAELAKRNSAMVEFFYGEEQLYTFALTGDTLIIQSEPLDSAFMACLDRVQQVQADEHFTDFADQYWDDAYCLFQQLLGDLGQALPENLLLIPDGRLNYLSFDALCDVSRPGDLREAMFHELPFLVYDHILSYDYSYTIRQKREPYTFQRSPRILGMAPSFDSTDLAALPKAQENIAGLGQAYEAVQVSLDTAATIEQFRRYAPTVDLVDLATHGKMDASNSNDCRLYFSADSLSDGRLHLGEIYNLDLDLRLAILRACESGLGPNARGEGVMSLARGFSYAGCRTTVTSLWNVAEEKITTEILNGFYHNLAEGFPVDSALTLAKRQFLLAHRESPGEFFLFFKPFFWSEMIVIGDTQPIPIQKRSRLASTGLLAGIAFTLLVIISLALRRQLRRKNN